MSWGVIAPLLLRLLVLTPSGATRALAHNPASQTFSGDGSVRLSRLPFLAGNTVTLTTGWLGGSHVGQYATAWR